MFKLIAIISMVVGHIGSVFFPENEWLNIIGKLAFPLFAYQIAQGIIHTSNIKKYMQRLLLFGLISIIPYYLVFDVLTPNIILAFSLTVFIVYLWEKKDQKMFATIIFAALFFIDIEYGVYGVVAILLFKANLPMLFIPLTIGKAIVEDSYIQLFALLAFPIIFYSKKIEDRIDVKINKWFYYWFYPAHLFLIYIIQQFI